MAEPARDRAATGSPSNGAGGELAQLRQLLIGEELNELAAIRGRLDDPRRRSADLAQVLPDAIKATRAKALRTALEPIFEKTFQSSVRKHTRELADAIYPVIGLALRNSIAAAIREFAESLNQVVEKSLSFRAIRWRIEALLTGKPFSEILLARSLLYSVQHVFLIHRRSGLLLYQAAAQTSVLKDADMISGMLTAIQDFVTDSFSEAGQELETVDAGRFKLWIQYGSKAMLVGAVTGNAPVQLRGVFRNALDQIHEALYAQLDRGQQDDLSVFEPARPYLERCLLGQLAPEARKPILPWLLAGAAVAVVGGFSAYAIRQQAPWNRYFAELKRAPGIVVVSIEKQGPQYLITGLRDPKALDPQNLLRQEGLDPARVRYEWRPFLSLDSSFVAERDLEEARTQIEKQLIRFESGSSRLALAEVERVESLTAAIHRVLERYPNSRVTIMGHADELGNGETNTELSLARAQAVVAALVEQGLSADHLEAIGVGNTRPVLTGSTDWARASNRSASFQLSAIPR